MANGSVYWIDPEEHNIKFTEPKEELYRKYPRSMPANVWYSEKPFIDANVRKRRFEHIVVSLYRNGFPLGDWASKIVEVVITRQENGKVAKEDNKSDSYNYEPDFKKNKDGYKLKFFEIFKQYKIYTFKNQYFSIPISKNINHDDTETLINDKDILRNKDVDELKNQILENERFAESRGQYEAEKKNKENIYKVDSFSEEQNFAKDKLFSNNSTFHTFKENQELFIVTDKEELKIDDLKLEKVIKINDHPALISNFDGMNIVRYNEMYYAIPQGLRMNWLQKSDLLDQHIKKSLNLDDLFKQLGKAGKNYKLSTKLKIYLITINWLILKYLKLLKIKELNIF